MTSLRRAAISVAAFAVVAIAAVVLWREVGDIGAAAWRREWQSVDAGALVASICFTAASFACLGVLEWLAVRSLGVARVPGRRALATGAVTHALCNTIGFHAVLAPALRLALYRLERITASEVARLLAVVAGGIGAGVAGVAALAAATAAGGAAGLATAVALTAMVLTGWHSLAARTPSDTIIGRLLQAGSVAALVGLLESAFAMAALYVLLPAASTASLAQFVLAFTAAGVLGIVSHAPGGLGVFEAAMLGALPGDRAPVLAALLMYRLVYNLLPAAVAAVALAVVLARQRGGVSSTAGSA